MVTEQDPEKEKGEKEVSIDHPYQSHVMILGKEATDPLLKEEPKGTLLVEVTVGDIQVEGMAGIRLETAVTGHTLETGIEVNHNTRTEGLQVLPETVIMITKGKGMIETGVIEEVSLRKDKEMVKEKEVEEEKEKRRKVKVMTVN